MAHNEIVPHQNPPIRHIQLGVRFSEVPEYNKVGSENLKRFCSLTIQFEYIKKRFLKILKQFEYIKKWFLKILKQF